MMSYSGSRCCHRSLQLIVILTLASQTAVAQSRIIQPRAQQTGFVQRNYQDAQGTHKYQVFIPYNYSQKASWPVVLFLHGAGERGNDGQLQTTVGLGAAIRSQPSQFPAIVVFPQCEDTAGPITEAWRADSPDGNRALEILTEVEREFKTDPTQRILTGWSMGGFGVWNMAAALPTSWSAVVPLAGGGSLADADKLKEIPIWAIHGNDDRIVLPNETRRMVQALKEAGSGAHQSIVTGVGHDVWKYAYSDSYLIRWMFDPTSVDPNSVNFSANVAGITRQEAVSKPFRPAIDISQAVSVRIGNDALHALADSIPQIVTADALTGRVADINDMTTAEGRNFRVRFSSINYTARLVRARLKAYQTNRLNIQLAMSNVNLTIGRTDVTGKRRSAVAGPMRVSLGHRRPIWLSIDVTPYISGRTIRLRHVGTWFEIPEDNFSVSPPAGVSVDGWGMTSEKVSASLVQGIYGRRSRLEDEMKKVATTIVSQIERYLDFSQTGDVAKAIWPLPVYRPDTRVWPADVSTDSHGVSLSFGISAESIKPQAANPRPRQVTAVGPSAAEISRNEKLEVGLSFSLLETLSQLLIEQGLARIHLQDIPGRTFSPLLQRELVEKIIPRIKEYPESSRLRAQLVFSKPISVGAADEQSVGGPRFADQLKTRNVSSTDEVEVEDPADGEDLPTSASFLRLRIPGAQIAYSIQKSKEENTWEPLETFEFDIDQAIQVEVVQPAYVKRVLQLTWSGAPDVRSVGSSTADQELLRNELATAWSEWTRSFSHAETEVRDIDFGFTRMRLYDAYEDRQQLLVRYTEPVVKIVNRSDQVLSYQTRTPYSSWGGPYELQPGKSHKYSVTTPLLYRRQANGRYSGYTLPIGSLSIYRTPATGGAPSLFQATQEFPDAPQNADAAHEK